MNEYNTVTPQQGDVYKKVLVQNGVAIAVGTKSFGKGTVQTTKFVGKAGYEESVAQGIAGVPDNAFMKYTVAFYLTPNGNNIHKNRNKDTKKPIERVFWIEWFGLQMVTLL